MFVRANSGSGGGGNNREYYIFGTAGSASFYSIYQSSDDTYQKYGYNSTAGVKVDDDNITISHGSNHAHTITFKKDGYLMDATRNSSPEFCQAGTSFSNFQAGSYVTMVIWFEN